MYNTTFKDFSDCFHVFLFLGTPSAQEGWAISFTSKGEKNHPLSKTDWLLNMYSRPLAGEKASCPARVLKSFWGQFFLTDEKIYSNPYWIDRPLSRIRLMRNFFSFKNSYNLIFPKIPTLFRPYSQTRLIVEITQGLYNQSPAFRKIFLKFMWLKMQTIFSVSTPTTWHSSLRQNFLTNGIKIK